jgi:hypothetical protein
MAALVFLQVLWLALQQHAEQFEHSAWFLQGAHEDSSHPQDRQEDDGSAPSDIELLLS